MTEAEALKRFIPILGRISTPYERATIVMRVNERINDSQRTSLLGVTRRHVAALAWPSDPVQAKQFEDKLNAAADAGDFVSLISDGKHLQIEELLAWPDCPAISPDSPLTFWLGEPAPATDTVTPAPVVGIATNSTTPDPERRLARLRALGGDAIYRRGEWKITGISALVASEKGEGRRRSDEKTIRVDLKEAAENEREARRANAFAGLGQR